MTILRALVCDDEAPLRDLMARRLEKMGLEVERAESGKDAAERLGQQRYDLLITDIYMPDVTGLQLLQQMKTLDAHSQVVVVTASATLDNAVQALNHGAFAYLTKPFDHLTVFDNVVSRAVDFRRALLDNLRMGQVQRRRGDLLEQEIAGRIQQLKRTQDFLERLLAILPVGVAVFDGEGRLELANPRAEALLGDGLAEGQHRLESLLSQIPEQGGQRRGEVEFGGRRLEVGFTTLDIGREETGAVVVARESDEGSPAAGSLVREALVNLRRGLTWISRREADPDGQKILRGMAHEVRALARLHGVELTADEAESPSGRPGPAAAPGDLGAEGLAPAVFPPRRSAPEEAGPGGGEVEAGAPPAPEPEAPIPQASSSLMLRKGMTMVLEGRLKKKKSTSELTRRPEDTQRMQMQIERWARTGEGAEAGPDGEDGEHGDGQPAWPPVLPSDGGKKTSR